MIEYTCEGCEKQKIERMNDGCPACSEYRAIPGFTRTSQSLPIPGLPIERKTEEVVEPPAIVVEPEHLPPVAIPVKLPEESFPVEIASIGMIVEDDEDFFS